MRLLISKLSLVGSRIGQTTLLRRAILPRSRQAGLSRQPAPGMTTSNTHSNPIPLSPCRLLFPSTPSLPSSPRRAIMRATVSSATAARTRATLERRHTRLRLVEKPRPRPPLERPSRSRRLRFLLISPTTSSTPSLCSTPRRRPSADGQGRDWCVAGLSSTSFAWRTAPHLPPAQADLLLHAWCRRSLV